MNRIRILRKKKKLTQQELADIIEVTKRTYIYWEKGERIPKSDKAQQLADYFGVSIGYLLGVEPDRDGGVETLLEEVKEIRQYACIVADFNRVFIPESEVISVIEKYIKQEGKE